MNPYQSPLNLSDNPNAEFPWRRWLLIAGLLVVAAGLITPAFMKARQSGSYASHSTMTQRLSQDFASGCVESANGRLPTHVTTNP